MSKAEILSKYSKLLVADSKTKTPILEGIHYAYDGSAVVTNRHIMLRLRGAHSFQQAITLHHKTGAPIEGVYPDVSRVVPEYKKRIDLRFGAELDKTIKHTKAALTIAEIWSKAQPLIGLEVEFGVAYLAFKADGIDVKAFFANTYELEASKRNLNARYLLTALQIFDSARSDVSVSWDRPGDPILLSNGEDIDIVIMPYRTTA